jgi:endonuclease III
MSTRVTRSALKRQADAENSIKVSKARRIVKNSENATLAISKELIIAEISSAHPMPPKTKRASKKPPPKSADVTKKAILVTNEKQSPKKKSSSKAADESFAFPALPAVVLPAGATPATLLHDACAHLIAVDARFKALIKRHHCKLFSPESLATIMDPFTALTSSIISQQVSGAAAATIQRRFIALFQDDDAAVDPPFPTPTQVAAADIPFLRTAGLSQRKAEFIQGLAAKFASGELSPEILNQSSDEEVLEKLLAVRGLGKWTVEMFICFGLKRIDVFSFGDLSVQYVPIVGDEALLV